MKLTKVRVKVTGKSAPVPIHEGLQRQWR